MESLESQFYNFVNGEIEKIKSQYAASKTHDNKKVATEFVKKYPFLKAKKETMRVPYLDDVLQWKSVADKFDAPQIDQVILALIAKITGIYKHGQTDKTLLCNKRIVSNVKHNKLSIAISKNTLFANVQWRDRLINDLKELFPGKSLEDLILIISSEKIDLDGNATHCKNMSEAIKHYTRGNFRIIFLCSNNTRIADIIEFLASYNGFGSSKQIPIEIQHDEAHNREEGIPSKRDLIENIIINPFVKTYIPVSASNHPICDEERVLWKRINLEMYAIDYTQYSQTLSTSPEYASIAKTFQIPFSEIKEDTDYKEYNIQEFDEKTFDEADTPGRYTDWDPVKAKEDRNKRRKLEFHHLIAFEKEACNLGMNVIDNFYYYDYIEDDVEIETQIILPGKMNLHLIITSKRVVLTIHLIKYALKQSYNPICIGIYRSELHFYYKNRFGQTIHKKFSDLSNSCTCEQLNEKIFELLEYIRKQGDSIERPILIMGNYKPTGESVTFLNYKYGIIRSVTLLPSVEQTREANYQGFLRCCYIDRKFRENDPSFMHPPRWIIGSEEAINDALDYEKENDDRIYSFRERKNETGNVLIPNIERTYSSDDDDSNISIPIKIQVEDAFDPLFTEYRTIIAKPQRNEEDKKHIMQILKKLIEGKAARFNDPTGRFNWDSFTLHDVRCWKGDHTEQEIKKRKEKKEKKGEEYTPFEADSRFSNYEAAHEARSPYMNNKNKIKENNCELLTAYKRYDYDGCTNHISTIWISYRFKI